MSTLSDHTAAAGAAFDPFAARPPAASERAEFVALVQAADVHGIYVANELEPDRSGRALAARGLGFYTAQGPQGLAWFGSRGNLVVLLAAGARLSPREVARAVAVIESPWRIALGPPDVLAALGPFLSAPPVILRRQLYYEAERAAVMAAGSDPRARLAAAADLEALVAASLALNQSDLALDPARVSQRWVRHAARERVRARTAWVLGPVGSPFAKLDVGSQGSAGAVLEGVFTLPGHRGRGYARALVHAVSARLLAGGRPRVCLHVAESNAAARACYAGAGMRERMMVGLLLKQ